MTVSAALSPKPWCLKPTWRVCICVLLVGLILYNPFAALSGTSGELSYEKLARNRASIGSSELQHFNPVSGPDVQKELAVEANDAEVVQTSEPGQPRPDQQVLLLSEPALYAEVWFRPPPSL